MPSLKSVFGIFAVREDEPELAIAQVKTLARQIPVLHSVLMLDAIAVAYTHYGVTPDWLTLLPLGVLLTICTTRLLIWKRAAAQVIDPAEAVRRLRGTTRLTAILTVGFAAWALLLTRYGDVGTQMHVLFFLTITMIACVFCLLHLRSAALIIGVIALPVTALFLFNEAVVVRATALNYAAVVCVIVFVQSTCYRDFRSLVRLGAENRSLAHTDTLTGLPNRRSFFARMQATIADSERHAGCFVVGMIDLDGFKPVNDTFGHQVGDAVLCEVGRRLETVMANSGLAGRGWAARLGGDEFGLVIEGDTDLDALGRTLCAALAVPCRVRDATAQIGASIGFARYPASARSVETLVERADHALYHAKSHCRGTAICFTHEHEARLRSHAAIEQALRGADLEAEFDLAFQPIVDVQEARIEAYEALARWRSPVLGPVSPAEFIAVAERSGLIQDLTQVLLRKALLAARTWPEAVRLSFNLSSQDIASPEGLARITAAILASGVAPGRIIFEVTETGLMRDLVDARRALLALEGLGVRIALDDFGTGYSSLSYVHRLPIRKIKVDRSFVTDIGTDPASLNIVRSILDLCRNLGLACIVEGVETEAQARALREIGCRHMQGYLFGRPRPLAEIAGACQPMPAGGPGAGLLTAA
ncbi:putative bifunctional diguanylate cyclase/phosphodiesterase [Methylobacterium nigriterrae]|uniref:putative bifunctional diguanylate cyclase/phosphodiesterase n=1 Tax=Methylobacterium nigriterrae TaxID=3127512 RepID=UPI00301366E9